MTPEPARVHTLWEGPSQVGNGGLFVTIKCLSNALWLTVAETATWCFPAVLSE